MWPFSKLFTRSKAAASAKVATSSFQAIVENALRERGNRDDDMRVDPAYREPNYVVRMCQALHEQLQTMGQQSVTLSEVMALERSACGHIDYIHKLDLRLSQLATGGDVRG